MEGEKFFIIQMYKEYTKNKYTKNINRYANARRSYLYFSHFAGEAILFSSFFCILLLFDVLFSHENVNTLISDLLHSLNWVIWSLFFIIDKKLNSTQKINNCIQITEQECLNVTNMNKWTYMWYFH